VASEFGVAVASDFQARVYSILVRDHGINEDLIARNLAGVIRGEAETRTYDGSGNLVSRRVVTRPVDQAVGLAIFDRISGGQLGIGKELVDVSRSTRELYSEFMPMISDNESVVYRKPEVIVVEAEEVKEG